MTAGRRARTWAARRALASAPIAVVTVVGALVLAPQALARSGWFGYGGGGSLSGGMGGCPSSQSCSAYASGGAEFTSPVTGNITKFTLTHSIDQGAGQTATLLVLDDATGTVKAESAAESLSTTTSTETFTLASPVAIQRGQALAVSVTPGASQSPDNVIQASGYTGGQVQTCPTPAVGNTFTSCYAATPSGVVAVEAYVQDAQAPPSVVSYSPPASVTATSATVSAQVNPNGQDTSCYFAYGTSSSSLGQQTAPVDIGNGSTATGCSAGLTGLNPRTTYYYQAVASNYNPLNDSGDTTFGAIQSNLTTPAAPPPSVAGQAVVGVGEHQATLTGTVASNGFAASWRFQYGTDTGYGSTSAGGTVGSGSGATPQAVSDAIGGLTANTTYHYRLVATNVGGTSTTQDGTFTTARGQAPTIGAYATAGAGNGDPTREAVSFAINGDGYGTTFHLDYGATTGYGSSTAETASQSAAGSAPTDSVGLTGLTPSTTYHYRVVATNQWGTSYGPDETFATPAPPTPFLSGFQVTYLDPAAIYGELTVDDRGWPAAVYVQYGTSTSYGSQVQIESTLGYALDDVLDFAIGNLAPATVYHWRAVATNQWGTTYGPDETTVTLSLDRLAQLLDLLGGSSPRSAPTVAVSVAQPVVTLGRFSCPPACAVSVSFTLPNSRRHGRAQPLGSTSFKIPAGRKLQLGVKLSHRADRLLRSHHRLHVTARYKITDAHGNTTTIIRQLTLSAGGHHRR